ncbi:MAG: EF-P lysine aminoacylase GenX [Geobacteraceae bacterium]|nr:EF-P lysine aminoacylase GenX [Geobacteraceae bacterium]
MNGIRRFPNRYAFLRSRAKIVAAVRTYFERNGFLEVDTPHRIPVPIPEAHIDVIPSGSWVLHPSPEICMKRLLAGGLERIFQICHCWRYGERGSRHLPEFTMLEWYRAHADYFALMDDCEEMIRFAAVAAGKNSQVDWNGRGIALDGPWERLTVRDAFSRFGGIPVEEALEQDLFDEIMVCSIEPMLGWERPTFLIEYPAQRGSLARLKAGDCSVAERFELYIGGLELANAYSELNDPEEQRDRFILEQAARQDSSKLVYPLPEKFLQELSDMPPSAGIAFGIDRLVMLLTGASSIDDVVAFTPEEL